MEVDLDKEKTDKLVDYFKHLSTLHLASIGVLVIYPERFHIDENFSVELCLWIAVCVMTISFIIIIHGYSVLIDSYYDPNKEHMKIVTRARKLGGYPLIASILVFLFSLFLEN